MKKEEKAFQKLYAKYHETALNNLDADNSTDKAFILSFLRRAPVLSTFPASS